MISSTNSVVTSLLASVGAGSGGGSFDGTAIATWVITALYLVASAECFRALRAARLGAKLSRLPREQERREKDRSKAYRASSWFWGAMAVMLLALAAIVQFGLIERLTEAGRAIAIENGWYSDRHGLQTIAVSLLAVGGIVTLAFLLRRTRHLMPRHLPAFVGAAALAWYLVTRSTSLHAIDAWFGSEWLGLQLGWLIEAAALFCVGYCALANRRWRTVKAMMPK